MPATLGQAIINARQVVPDMPQVLPPTVASAAVVSATGSTLPAGTYAVQVTQRNAYGETIAVGETTGLVVGANQGIQITSALQPSATTVRAYLTMPGGAAGTEQQFIESASSPFTIATPLSNAGTPPQLNKAFLPDTDGGLISATSIFGWANDGLKILSGMAGGLLDYCGVQSKINQPLYTIPQQWLSITAIWYDGYWMTGGDRGQFWRRNNITSAILSSATISVVNGQNILEVYPQPARTAASTTLAAPMSAQDTTATLTSTSGFVLPFGFVNIDGEIMAYGAINGNQLTGLIRGLGGSAASAHLATTPALELNLFWNGKRQIDPNYQPGQSASVLPIPVGWDVLLAQYISGRAKNIEHDGQYWQQLMASMKESVKDWANSNKPIARRRQIGPPNSPGVLFPDIAGGLIRNALFPVLYVVGLEKSLYYLSGDNTWPLLSSMFFSTLALIWCAMSVKRSLQRTEKMHTPVRPIPLPAPAAGSGWRNFAHFPSNLFSKSLKSVKANHGESVKDSGFAITEAFAYSSTLDTVVLTQARQSAKNCAKLCLSAVKGFLGLLNSCAESMKRERGSNSPQRL